MRKSSWLLAAVVIMGTALGALGETYGVDPVHSSVVFRVKHNNVSYFYGRVNAPEGTIVYDAAKPEESSFTFSLKTASIDTGNAGRDTHLKSADFFNAAEFGTITFKSTGVKKATEENTLEVTGDLTIHGVKKSVTVKMEMTGQATVSNKPLIGFESVFTLKRTDYGMTGMTNLLGDEVRLMVAFEAGKK